MEDEINFFTNHFQQLSFPKNISHSGYIEFVHKIPLLSTETIAHFINAYELSEFAFRSVCHNMCLGRTDMEKFVIIPERAEIFIRSMFRYGFHDWLIMMAKNYSRQMLNVLDEPEFSWHKFGKWLTCPSD